MKKKYTLILSGETSFARRVTLAEIITRPLNPWLQMIPGMFIFDFLKRAAEIRRYSNYLVYPRRLALDLAGEIIQGQQREKDLFQAEEKIKPWLELYHLNSPAILQRCITILHILVEHYIKLLQTDENTYYNLVRGAYKTLVNYDFYIEKLTAAERELEKAIHEKLGDEAFTNRITKQRQVEEQRNKEKQAIF